jgi:hypothetical protein
MRQRTNFPALMAARCHRQSDDVSTVYLQQGYTGQTLKFQRLQSRGRVWELFRQADVRCI